MSTTSATISRRDMVRNAGLIAGAGMLGLNSPTAQPQSAPAIAGSAKPQTIALIGDRYHPEDGMRVAFARVFRELDLPITFTSHYETLSRDLLKDYQVFLFQRNAVNWPQGYVESPVEHELENVSAFPKSISVPWMTQEQAEAVKDFVSSGHGLYSFHNNSIVSEYQPIYRDVQGGAFIGHPPIRPFRVRPTANKHPITEGIGEFMVTDEQHYVYYDKDPKHLILEAENIDGLEFISRESDEKSGNMAPNTNLGTKSHSGWAFDYGSGRVVFTAVGHTIYAKWVPEYIEIQKRSVKWLLKQI